MTPLLFVGTAAWSLPKAWQAAFPGQDPHLARYARVLTGVEINSSFYRPHQPKTYARWAASVPAGFRFALKVPRTITHSLRLRDAAGPLDAFLYESAHLGDARGPLLVQLPPSLAYDAGLVSDFLALLRDRHDGPVVLEPRHRSWFAPAPDAALAAARVARCAADPAVVPQAAAPGGWRGLSYYRWHGSPAMYRSDYPQAAIAALAATLAADPAPERWAIFDNTSLGHATGNALALLAALRG